MDNPFACTVQVWAMVHSSCDKHVHRGAELARAKLREDKLGDKDLKEYKYLLAGACQAKSLNVR